MESKIDRLSYDLLLSSTCLLATAKVIIYKSRSEKSVSVGHTF